MPSPNHPTHGQPIITYEDYQKFRALAERYESSPENKPQDIDLNNPPKVPYKHQDFPRLVYAAHYDGDIHSNPDRSAQEKRSMTLAVADQEELDAALEDGYVLDPPMPTEEAGEVVVPARKSRKKSE